MGSLLNHRRREAVVGALTNVLAVISSLKSSDQEIDESEDGKEEEGAEDGEESRLSETTRTGHELL